MNKRYYIKKDRMIDAEIKKRREIRDRFYKIEKEMATYTMEEDEQMALLQEISNNQLSTKYGSYPEREFKEYYLTCFKDVDFGLSELFKQGEFVEYSDLKFKYVDFINCNFNNVRFINCSFHACRFTNCKTHFGRIIFDNCILSHLESDKIERKMTLTKIHTEFNNCNNLSIEVIDGISDYMLFDNCSLSRSSIIKSNISDVIFNDVSFEDVLIENSYIKGLMIKGTVRYNLKFLETRNSVVLENDIYISRVGLYNYRKKLSEEYQEYLLIAYEPEKKKNFIKRRYSEVAKMYYTILSYIKTNNFNDDYVSEYSYLYNKYLIAVKNDPWDKFVLLMSWILFGFGERMGRFVFWSFGYITSFSIAYMFTGITDSTGKVIKYSLSGGNSAQLSEIISDFFQCMHFSVITFSTVGYGNITPYGWSLLVSAIQVITGIVVIALFTSVVVKKFLR